MKIAGYETHPAADLFPMLDDVGLQRLAEDIKTQGQKVPIVLLDGKVLDGRNRLLACKKGGVEPRFVQHDGSNPWRAVWSLNKERRHITDAVRLALIGDVMVRGSYGWDAEQAKAKEKTAKGRAKAVSDRRGKGGKATSRPSRDGPLERDKSAVSRSNEETSRVAKDLGVSSATLERARKIAADPVLAEAVRTGDMKGMEALRTAKRNELAERATKSPSGKYRVVYADPPWSYGNSRPDAASWPSVATKYPTMKLSDVCAIPVKEWIDENAVLFLWVTSPVLEEAFQVVKAWGFTYKASFIWDKVAHNMGNYNSVRHELLLVCTRGSCTPDVRKLFDSVITEERTEHSVKPDVVYEIIETLYTHGRRLEMFQRRERKGWTGWGLEAPSAVA